MSKFEEGDWDAGGGHEYICRGGQGLPRCVYIFAEGWGARGGGEYNITFPILYLNVKMYTIASAECVKIKIKIC